MHTAFYSIRVRRSAAGDGCELYAWQGKYKEKCKSSIKTDLMDPDYQFVTDHESFLGRIQTACMRVRPDEVTGRVRKLQEAIENNDFPGMRRYADSDPVIAAAAVCRAEMEPALDDLNPF